MTTRHLSSFGSKSLIAMLLMSVVDVTLPAATARAEECLAAPNFPAREGTRWYYRLERATQHKCWYMRALGQPTPQAGAPAKTTLRAPAFGIPVPRPRPLTADSSPVGTDLSPSHAEGIVAKQSATPPVSGSTAVPKESTSQQAGLSLAAPVPNATPRAATDENTSAISEIHQVAPSPETTAAATSAAPHAEPPIGPTTDETGSPTSGMTAPQQAATPSEPNAQVAALAPIAAPQIIARIDDGVSSIQNDSATQPSTSSKFRSNAAEPAPDVSVAQPHAGLAAATVNASPIPLPPRAPADLVSDGRETISLIDEPIGDAGMRVDRFISFSPSWWPWLVCYTTSSSDISLWVARRLASITRGRLCRRRPVQQS
jgi:hypothetical protein